MTTIEGIKNMYDAINLIIDYCETHYCNECMFFDEQSRCILKYIERNPSFYRVSFKVKIAFEEVEE